MGSKYQILSATDDEVDGDKKNYVPNSGRPWVLICGNLLLSILCLVLAAALFTSRQAKVLNECSSKASYYSPILERLDLPTEVVEHDDTLFTSNVYRKAPSAEVDLAWAELTDPRFLYVDSDTIRRIGKDPELVVHHPTMTPHAYVTMPAVSHQLHCLNSLRKNLFPKYYYPNGSSAPAHLDHLHHCVDLIRKTLMCNANLDLITYNWVEHIEIPQPDFRVNMMCRSWDTLQEYMDRPIAESGFFNANEEGWISGWKRVGGERDVGAPRRAWELWLEEGVVSQEEMNARWGL